MSRSGLEAIIAATGDVVARRADGTLGERVEVRCPECGWHAWSYSAYQREGVSIADASAWLLAQHSCNDQLSS